MKKRIQVLALVFVVTCMLSPLGVAGPIFNGHEYEVVLAEAKTWSESRALALALGAGWDLASIGDVGENNFVVSLLNPALPDRSHFWLGATDGASEGVWT